MNDAKIVPFPALRAEAAARPTPKQASALLAVDQVHEGIRDLYDDETTGVHFPFAALDRLHGPMMPGRVCVVAANTGQGKTTFVLDVLDKLADSGHVLYMLGLEQKPKELRTKWACLRAGVDPAIAMEKAWGTLPNGDALRDAVAAEYEQQMGEPWSKRVQFDPATKITSQVLRKAAQKARDFDANVLIVDYIGRIAFTGGEFSYQQFAETVQLCSELADEFFLSMIVCSQLNRTASAGDRLAKYQPPQLNHLHGGGAIEHEADSVLGLYRPLKTPPVGSEKEWSKTLAAARSGAIQVRDVLEPNRMRVVVLKHRIRDVEGYRCDLSVHRGRVSDLDSPEALAAEASQHGIRTNRDL